MKNSTVKDLNMIDKLLNTVPVVRVHARMFEDILTTYPASMHDDFRARGIERKQGKFIKTFKHL